MAHTLASVCPCGRCLKSILTHIRTELEGCLRILLITALHETFTNYSVFSQERKPSSHPCPRLSQVEQKHSNIVSYSMINSTV